MRGQSVQIIYEDDWLIVADKPSGLLTMSTGKASDVTAYSILTGHFGKIFIVHRLDRDTSGLLVFAKDEETKLSLQENWEDAVLERRYTAILEGSIDDEEGWIETWLYENPRSMKVHTYDIRKGEDINHPPRKDWQYASSHCRKKGNATVDGHDYTLVEFELETGRKNQIRAHSEYIGHPVAGDRKYGAKTNPIGRLALHAESLSFIHPWTGKTLRFTSPVPRSFKRLQKGAGRH